MGTVHRWSSSGGIQYRQGSARGKVDGNTGCSQNQESLVDIWNKGLDAMHGQNDELATNRGNTGLYIHTQNR